MKITFKGTTQDRKKKEYTSQRHNNKQTRKYIPQNINLKKFSFTKAHKMSLIRKIIRNKTSKNMV